MKILFDTEIFELQIFGGISLYVTKLLDSFYQDGNIEPILPLIYSDNYYLKEFRKIKSLKIKEEDFFLKKQLTKFLYFLNRQKTIKALNQKKFDIFHPTYFNNYFLKHLKEKPYVLTVHDMTNEAVPEFFVFDKRANQSIKIKKKLIENAAGIISISENTKKDILRFCNVKEDKIDLIYHGCPFNNIDNHERPEGLPEKYILFIGQRAKYKNFYNFLASISEILLQDKDLYLLTVGGNDFNKSELDFIKKLDLKHKIIKKPVQSHSQLIAYYKQALCFVFPSVYEGFGFPILESFQCGCPLVCSDTSSFPEVAGDGAEYFDPYYENSIKDAVLKVLNNVNHRQKLIAKGYERLKLFSWQHTAELTKKTYRKVLENG